MISKTNGCRLRCKPRAGLTTKKCSLIWAMMMTRLKEVVKALMMLISAFEMTIMKRLKLISSHLQKIKQRRESKTSQLFRISARIIELN